MVAVNLLKRLAAPAFLVFAVSLPEFAFAQQSAPANAPSLSQPPNPAYLAGFPPRDRVMLNIHGSTPLDSLERQVATLHQLMKIVARLQMAQGRAFNSATADEQRLTEFYAKASDELAQRYLKTAPPDGAKSFQEAVARYELDQGLSDQVNALLAPPTLTEIQRINGTANAQTQARVDQIRRDNANGVVPTQAPVSPAAGEQSPFIRNDPGTLAVRRCLELGGGDLECIGKGFTTGLFDLVGVNVKALTPPTMPPGVRMGGTYKTAQGLALAFGSETVAIGGCGKLVEDGRHYSVTRRGNLLDVSIDNASKPLVVSLGPDGQILGPTAFDLDGRI